MAAPTSYEIGATLLTMQTLNALGVVAPKSDFSDYTDTIVLASGLTRGIGYPSAEWAYGFLTSSQYDVYKSFCSGVGASVYIAMPDNSRVYKRYSANMTLPTRYTIRSGDYIDVVIRFTHLIEAE